MTDDAGTPTGRSGWSTGTCATAAARASVLALCGQAVADTVTVELPDGDTAALTVESVTVEDDTAWAAVLKDAGDDPDVTDGVLVLVGAQWLTSGDVEFAAGEGVGTVTLPGLQIPPGQPAINPVPRQMMRAAVRAITDRPVRLTVAIPGGRELAAKTFNPRLGIEGGLSILGTSGRVRPFSLAAVRETIRCALRVCLSCGNTAPVLVPGNIGLRAARQNFRLAPQQAVEVSNEWGFALAELRQVDTTERVLLVGHPGKLAKLARQEWDTHSARSQSAVPFVRELAAEALGRTVPDAPTVDGVLSALEPGGRRQVCEALAERIAEAVSIYLGHKFAVAVALTDMEGTITGMTPESAAWQ